MDDIRVDGTPAGGGWWTTQVSEPKSLRACIAQGATLAQSVERLRDVLALEWGDYARAMSATLDVRSERWTS